MDWTQVMTILGGNLAMFLWAHRQARSDFFHLDKKIDDHRREAYDLIQEMKRETQHMINSFTLVIKDEMADFNNKLLKIEKERKV